VVLAGDAAHTAHFSIGSGTKLAIEDAVALSSNLYLHDGVKQALRAYEQERKQALRRFQRNAHFSASWFENIERYLGLPDRKVFMLLRKRRSPVMARIPPRVVLAPWHRGKRAGPKVHPSDSVPSPRGKTSL
jgi:2-polyprenyl-6-methoxyphenol hydroxylase-like FAD-dependent oxidoreductase